MNTNMNPNTAHPNFGMAWKKIENPESIKKFVEYAGLNGSSVKQRGFKQFVKEQESLTRFDTMFLPDYTGAGNDAMGVINNKTNEIVDRIMCHPQNTGLSHVGSVHYPGKKLFAWLFNPKQFLKNSILKAGQKAKRLEQEAIKVEKLDKNIGNLI